MASPELKSSQIECEGSPVPKVFPRLRTVQIEYEPRPKVSGLFKNWVSTVVFSRATDAGVNLVAQIVGEDLLDLAVVNTNTSFDAQSKWRYLVLQYINRSSGQTITVRLSYNDVDDVWSGPAEFLSTSTLGTWEKRSIIIHAHTGLELVLTPTDIVGGDVTLNA